MARALVKVPGAPVGTVKPFAGTTAPNGYLMCDGSAVSRTTYAVLYAAIGDAFGEGDGSTTFNLPDTRGRFLRGVDGGAGNDPDAAGRTASNTGGNTGDNVGSLQADEMIGHSHAAGIDSASSGSPVTSSGNGYIKGGSGGPAFGRIATPTGTGVEITTRANPTGNESRPKNLNMNHIIKFI